MKKAIICPLILILIFILVLILVQEYHKYLSLYKIVLTVGKFLTAWDGHYWTNINQIILVVAEKGTETCVLKFAPNKVLLYWFKFCFL